MPPEMTPPIRRMPPAEIPWSFPSLLSLSSAELRAQFANPSACGAQAETAELEQAIKANLKGLDYGG